MLIDKDKERYSRQMVLSGWSEESQEKIKKSSVFIAGCGGLGSTVSLYLTAAGVGCLRICDPENITLSNLNRQILYIEKDTGKNKAETAKARLTELNSDIQIIALAATIDENNIEKLVDSAQIIIDCLDDFEARYILNKYCVDKSLPLIHGAVNSLSGQITFIQPGESPCLECIFPEQSSIKKTPVLGATAGLIGCLEAQEALKYITGVGKLLKSRLLFWNGVISGFEEVEINKNPNCPICG